MKQAFPRRIQLLAAMNDARGRGDLDAFYRLEEEHLRELTGRATRPTLDNLEARIDAIRRKAKAAPGQLDLFGAGSGTGPGGGEKCGNGWIDPRKTCRIGQGGPAAGDPSKAPIDTSKPFSTETMERIVSGIETRAFTSQGSRHDGTDLALALQKLAEAPGLMGQHAREAMAFMEEVQAIVLIRPTADHAPKLDVDESEGPPRYDFTLTPEQNLQALRQWELPRLNAAERGRNYAKRVGIWSDEFLDALKKDKSPAGQGMAQLISEARDGVGIDGKPTEAARQNQRNLEQWNKKVKELKEVGGTTREFEALQYVEMAFNELRLSTYTHGAGHMLERVKGALRKTLASPNTGGHYWPGGNTYWKASMAGKSGSRLNPDEIQPSGMQSLISNALSVDGSRREYHFSGTPGLKESEKALVTHLHELGHLVHDASARKIHERMSIGQITTAEFAPNSTRQAPPEIQQLVRAGKGPTTYADTNVAEMFAEGFVGYVTAPQMMQERNPELYRWVTATMQKARGNARALQSATKFEYS